MNEGKETYEPHSLLPLESKYIFLFVCSRVEDRRELINSSNLNGSRTLDLSRY
jgi:hypothetical protein